MSVDQLHKKVSTNILLTVLVFLFVYSRLAVAEEGGSGHYFPGSMSSFIDGVPGDPGFIVRGQLISYDGSVEIGRTIPVAGQVVGNAEAESLAIGLTLVWAPNWELGEKWSYAMTATIPWVDIKVTGDVSDTFDAVALGIDPPADFPATIQERAWTSPIWYAP